MEAIVLSGSVRTQFGKEATRKVRAAGRTPAVMYGHGLDESIALDLDPRALTKALSNPKGNNALFTIEMDGGKSYEALVRELQREPVSRAILHVDLVIPDQNKELVSLVLATCVKLCCSVVSCTVSKQCLYLLLRLKHSSSLAVGQVSKVHLH